MIISDLSQIEARVDIGEMDVVLIQAGQKASSTWIRSKKKFHHSRHGRRQFVGRIEREFHQLEQFVLGSQ